MEKHRYGQYFTIDVVADFMVNLVSHSKNCSVLEPSCGKGIFLDYLFQHEFTNVSAYEIDKTLTNKYDFIKYASFLSVPVEEKYDVIIGNPPYIRWKNLEPELKSELVDNKLWNKYFNNLCDYLFIFILKSIEHLTDGGELIFICSDYWMNTTHSESLRNYMCQNGYFSEIYHFKEAPLFEKVTASFVVFRYIKSKKRTETINLYNYTGKGVPCKNELFEKKCFKLEIIPRFEENSRWILASETVQDDIKRLEDACLNHTMLFDNEYHKIGDYCDIGNGMVSGLDKAFQIDNVSCLTKDETAKLINVIKSKDLKAYSSNCYTKYIFIQESITTDEFEKKYPHFAKHFNPFKESLEKRYSYNKIIPYWEFVFPRNQKLFERKENRIFVPCKERISNKNYFRFCMAEYGVFPTQDVTAIFKKVGVKESLEYILAYLNNRRVFNWLLFNGIVKGEIVEFSEAPIASIPFRPINWKSEREVDIHNTITNEVISYIKTGKEIHISNIENNFNLLFNE